MNQQREGNRQRRNVLFVALAASCVLGIYVLTTREAGVDPEVVRQIRAGNLDSAEAAIRQRLADHGETATDQMVLAGILRRQGEISQSQTVLAKAVRGGADKAAAEAETILARAQLGQIDETQAEIDQLLASGVVDGPEVLEAYVNGLLIQGRMEEAEASVKNWIEVYPNDPRGYYFHARIQLYYSRPDAAQAALEQSLTLAPESGPAAYLLGKVFARTNRPDAAATQFTKAAAVLKSNSAAKLEHAKVLRALGQPAAAREILSELSARSAIDLKRGFLRVGDRYDGAPVALELGSLEVDEGNFAAAIQQLEEAVAAAPHDLAARQALGLAYRGVGRNEDATHELEFVRDQRAALRKVDQLVDKIENNPQLIDERVEVGELYFRHGSSSTAEFWLKTALARDAQNARAHQLLAELYTARGQQDAKFLSAAKEHQAKFESLANPQQQTTTD